MKVRQAIAKVIAETGADDPALIAIGGTITEALGIDSDMSLTRLREDLTIATYIREHGGDDYVRFLLDS